MKNKKYCVFCKKIIPRESSFCPFCYKNLRLIEHLHKEKCSYCNILIPMDSNYCQYCGNSTIKEEEIKKDETSNFEYKGSFLCSGGNFFRKNVSVNIFLKNGKIGLKTFGEGSISFDIKKDFFSCERLDSLKIKNLGLNKDLNYISLVFNDKLIIMNEDDVGRELIEYIYSHLIDIVFEKENIFYNTEHQNFDIF